VMRITIVAIETFKGEILTPLRSILSVTGILPSGSTIANKKINVSIKNIRSSISHCVYVSIPDRF
jgi:hypothetical protein